MIPQQPSEEALSTSIPAPVRGWNTRDPLQGMEPGYAITLVNAIPQKRTVDIRPGYRVHATSMGSAAVQTLAEYNKQDGTKKLIAGANSRLYDATTYGAAGTSLVLGLTNNKWQWVNFKDRLVLVNGADKPLYYDGTSMVAFDVAPYTGFTNADPTSGLAIDATKYIHVNVWKSRLHFVEKNSCRIWRGDLNAYTGGLFPFDFSTVLRRGGYIQFAGSYTQELGVGSEDLYIIVSSEGEVLLYSGSFMGDLDWKISGRFNLGKPLGRRGFAHVDSDLAVLTEEGLLPLSKVLSQDSGRTLPISDAIDDSFRSASALYRSNFGWELCDFISGHLLIVNIPISESTISEQYVMNTKTLAWCRFTGINACSWGMLDNKIYFGGTDGKVYEWNYANSDNGNPITVDIRPAFMYLGDEQRGKQVVMGRPNLTTDEDLRFLFSVDVDFGTRQVTDSITIESLAGSDWDVGAWDIAAWTDEESPSTDWYTLTAPIGRCVSPRLRGSFSGINWKLAAIDLIYKPGGLLI